jgi:prepilin-type N-terminal cleavage/methylation domain-containing protein
MRHVVSPLRKADGFSMAEIMLSVAVLAILVSITAPPLITFMRQKDVREEQSQQIQIRDGMAAMLAATDSLPLDTATGNSAWYNVLAPYTNLSPYQIQFDQWNKPRAYIMMVNNQNLLGSPVSITYVTLSSGGPDGKASQITDKNGNVIVPVSGDAFAAASDSHWWKFNSTSALAAFGSVGISSTTTTDDIMLRFTNYPDKIAAYNNTLERLGKVTEALESYNRTAYANRVVACNSNPSPTDCVTSPPDTQINYPMGYGVTTGDSSSLYNATVISDTTTITGGTGYIYNGTGSATNDTARRTAMINLMRLLGLPDSYCCSAIDHFTDSSGAWQETPFFYASNPRARATISTCGNRYNGTSATIPLPARLTTYYTADGNNGASCF